MRTPYHLSLSFLILATASSLPAFGQSPEPHRGDAAFSDKNQGPLTPQRFVHAATRSGTKEVKLSRLALGKTENPKIREFAQVMVDDHSKANAELQEIAQRQGIQPSPSQSDSDKNRSDNPGSGEERDHPPRSGNNNPLITNRTDQAINSNPKPREDRDLDSDSPEAHRRTHEDLDRASGAEFDRLYVAAMVQDHKRAVALFEEAARSLPDSELQRFAQSTLPKLKHHQEMAKKLKDEVGAR